MFHARRGYSARSRYCYCLQCIWRNFNLLLPYSRLFIWVPFQSRMGGGVGSVQCGCHRWTVFDNCRRCSRFAESLAVSVRARPLCNSFYHNGSKYGRHNYHRFYFRLDNANKRKYCVPDDDSNAWPDHHSQSDKHDELFVVPLVCEQSGSSALECVCATATRCWRNHYSWAGQFQHVVRVPIVR